MRVPNEGTDRPAHNSDLDKELHERAQNHGDGKRENHRRLVIAMESSNDPPAAGGPKQCQQESDVHAVSEPAVVQPDPMATKVHTATGEHLENL